MEGYLVHFFPLATGDEGPIIHKLLLKCFYPKYERRVVYVIINDTKCTGREREAYTETHPKE